MSMVIADGLGATEKVAQVGTHGYGMGFAMDASGDSAPELLQRFRTPLGPCSTPPRAARHGPPQRSMTARRWSGTHSDIALDGNGKPHISYVDSTNGLLRYAHHDGSEWSLSTVDPSGSVIGHTSIAVDDDGRPRIAYHDGALRLAEWDGVITGP